MKAFDLLKRVKSKGLNIWNESIRKMKPNIYYST
jgi:hypothetical protein